jgi:hypothetical protein
MNRNLVGSIYGRSSIKDANFNPIHVQTWPPQAILVSDWRFFRFFSWFIWQSGFTGEDFLEINQSETRFVCGGHVC